MTDDPIVRMCRRFKRRWSKQPLHGLTTAEMEEIQACQVAFLEAIGSPPASEGAETPPEGGTRAGGAENKPGGQE